MLARKPRALRGALEAIFGRVLASRFTPHSVCALGPDNAAVKTGVIGPDTTSGDKRSQRQCCPEPGQPVQAQAFSPPGTTTPCEGREAQRPEGRPSPKPVHGPRPQSANDGTRAKSGPPAPQTTFPGARPHTFASCMSSKLRSRYTAELTSYGTTWTARES